MNMVLAPLSRRASILLKQQFCLTGAMLSFNTMSLCILQFSMCLGNSGVLIGVETELSAGFESQLSSKPVEDPVCETTKL